MPTALLPNGQATYVDHNLDLSISFPDRSTAESIEKTLRQALTSDPRQLLVRVQGGGGYGPWCFWIQWGSGPNCVRTQPVCLSESEQNPEAVLARVQAELEKLRGKSG